MYQYHDSTKDLLISFRESVYKKSKSNREFHILCVTLFKPLRIDQCVTTSRIYRKCINLVILSRIS